LNKAKSDTNRANHKNGKKEKINQKKIKQIKRN